MIVSFGVTCTGKLPIEALKPFNLNTTAYSDGDFHVPLGNIQDSKSDLLLDVLEKETSQIKSFHYDIYDDVWLDPDPVLVGAIIMGDETVWIDPNNVFDPKFPDSCKGNSKGIVPPSQPIKILEQPKGHVVSVGLCDDNDIFSSRICSFFLKYVKGTFGEVIYKQTVLAKWHRFFPEHNLDVIAEEGLKKLRCIHCNSLWLSELGIGLWLGHRMPDLTICRNKRGLRHSEVSHPLIVSPQIAQELCRNIGMKGYALRPILDVESPLAKRMLETYQRIRKMWIRRED